MAKYFPFDTAPKEDGDILAWSAEFGHWEIIFWNGEAWDSGSLNGETFLFWMPVPDHPSDEDVAAAESAIFGRDDEDAP